MSKTTNCVDCGKPLFDQNPGVEHDYCDECSVEDRENDEEELQALS